MAHLQTASGLLEQSEGIPVNGCVVVAAGGTHHLSVVTQTTASTTTTTTVTVGPGAGGGQTTVVRRQQWTPPRTIHLINRPSLQFMCSPFLPTAPAGSSSSSPSGDPGESVVIDLTGDEPQPAPRKRIAAEEVVEESSSTTAKKSKPEEEEEEQDSAEPPGEQRLSPFLDSPPPYFKEVYQLALSQKFYIIGRRRRGTPESPVEEFDLVGTTGNVYTVKICCQPTCMCPHFRRGGQCKHWLHVMSCILNAKYEYVYQLALLSTEVQEILAAAPPFKLEVPTEPDAFEKENRKPIDGDCAVCFHELEPKVAPVVWCQSACGQNMHEKCLDDWAHSKYRSGTVTCPLCRAPWEYEKPGPHGVVLNRGIVNGEGYLNVGDQLGLSMMRVVHPSTFRTPRRKVPPVTTLYNPFVDSYR